MKELDVFEQHWRNIKCFQLTRTDILFGYGIHAKKFRDQGSQHLVTLLSIVVARVD